MRCLVCSISGWITFSPHARRIGKLQLSPLQPLPPHRKKGGSGNGSGNARMGRDNSGTTEKGSETYKKGDSTNLCSS